MTRREYTFPDVGEGVAEGDLLEWYVSEGEQVEEDQVLAEVETDKAVVDIPSPVDGTVEELLYEEGDTIPVGETFVIFEVGDGDGTAAEETATEPESVSAGGATTDQQPTSANESTTGSADMAATADTKQGTSSPTGRTFASPSVRRLAREYDVDIDAVAGSGVGGRVTEADVEAAADTAKEPPLDQTGGPDRARSVQEPSAERTKQSTAETPTEPQTSAGTLDTDGQQASANRDRTLATPATRGVAHDLDVDINAVPAVTEREGEAFVTTEAVQAFAESGGEAPTQTVAGAVERTETEAETASTSVEERVPYRGVRRTIGEQMERSKFTIPHVSTVDEADVTELVEVRAELSDAAAEQDVNLTYLAFVIMAVGKALQEYPYVNATLDKDADEIVLKNYYNIGIATEAQDGLRVPVVKNVDQKGLLEIAAGVENVVQRARDGTISRDEMQNGTFTITNIGPYGGQHGTPIINHPEVAILAMGEITEKPRVVDGEIVPRHVMNLSMSFDHRVLDGATAQQFLNAVEEYLENPKLLLLD